MKLSKEQFIHMAIECQVLKFGEFTLKSGRISPYFFNLGLFYTGETLKLLGEYYAQIIIENQLHAQQLFGPAYKGLPLVTSTAIALATHGINPKVSFNRKEAKDHGEGGMLIGAPLDGEIMMIDDVITAGTAFRETKQLIHNHGAHLTHVLIALDRAEKGQAEHSTIDEIKMQGIQVYSIIHVNDLIHYLQMRGDTQQVEKMLAYRSQYGR